MEEGDYPGVGAPVENERILEANLEAKRALIAHLQTSIESLRKANYTLCDELRLMRRVCEQLRAELKAAKGA